MTRTGIPVVSVVVPVRDGGDDLRALLTALARQSVGTDSFEVVVADDGSRDGAFDGVEAGSLDLHVLHGPRRNSYAARNRGAAHARGEVLAFTDADCRPDPSWLEHGLAALEDADLVAGAVAFDAGAPTVNLWGLLDMDAYLDQERMVHNRTAATANLLMRRATYDAVGGFDASLPSNGDHDFVRRSTDAGARLTFAADARVHHPVRDSARGFMKKWWRTHSAYGARSARTTGTGRMLLLLVPGWRTWRSRRWHGQPAGLDVRRLQASGVRPHAWQRAAAVPLLYLLLPWAAFAAQATGRRRERRATAPVHMIPEVT